MPENGTLRVDVKGELAGILTLCDAGKKKPGQADLTGLVEQIKMVAGTRNHRELTLPPITI